MANSVLWVLFSVARANGEVRELTGQITIVTSLWLNKCNVCGTQISSLQTILIPLLHKYCSGVFANRSTVGNIEEIK